MSFKHAALRDLVVERLVIAADEIFSLFERTFAEYEEEFLLSKSAQEQRVELTVVPPLSVPADDYGNPEIFQEEQKPVVIKEEEPSLELPETFEENIENPTFHQQEPVEEHRPEPLVERSEGEEPGCSLDLHNNEQSYSCSDTDDSDNWESAAKTRTKSDQQDPDLVLIDESSTGRDDENTRISFPSFSGNTNTSVDLPTQAVFNLPYPPLKTAKKTYKCSVCSKVFDQKSHLKQHMQEEKLFSCPECGLRLSNKHKMHRHISAVHRKEKPHTCSVCQRAFAQKSNLISHLRTHSGERPYVCPCCGKDFRSQSLLSKHMQSHSLAQFYGGHDTSSGGTD